MASLPRLFNASVNAPRVAMITGATSPHGIGHATARLFAKHGAKVVLSDLEAAADRGRKTAQAIESEGGKAIFVPLDVADEAQWEEAIRTTEKAYGPLDVLFNNAGIFVPSPPQPESHPTPAYRKTLSVNVDGVYFGIKHGAKSMLKRDPKVKEAASIVVVSSIAGAFANGGPLDYTISKHAVVGATRHAAAELASRNIRVNSVHPGPISTNILDVISGGSGIPKDIEKAWEGQVPIGRWARPEEVANLVLFLASDESSYCVGGQFFVDGGFSTVGGGRPSSRLVE